MRLTPLRGLALNFETEYAGQTRRACESLYARYFPEDLMEAFKVSAKADISSGKNLCGFHRTTTMSRLWPTGEWICRECADVLFKSRHLGEGGRVVFDMTEPPEAVD